MTFWAYMLHCHGGTFYVGHTDDLERRVGQHKQGSIAGFTADHQPVELVWSQEFVTRDEAKAAEKQIKGWSRAKKLALIRGDWGRISVLARKKGGASTSSAQTGLGAGPGSEANSSPSFKANLAPTAKLTPTPDHPELVEGLTFSLLPHPQTPAASVRNLTARVRAADGLAWLTFEATPAASLKLPGRSSPRRTDGLWQSTCFELFVGCQQADYREFNFSPSGEWAAYRFAKYRGGMADLPMQIEPHINMQTLGDCFQLSVSLDARILQGARAMGLSAVIEELDGTRSYWALAHPPGQPDFHHPACFAATLPPPQQA
ncbi:MAG: GIY-YIG nuclease family protein [Sphingomonadaceae bacterium]